MKVSHVRDMVFTVYIGRPSVFGNPFVIGTHGNRTECIRKFEKYAWRSPRVLDAILKLPKKAILGCHCAPKECHGDTIIRIWKQLTAEAKEHATEPRAPTVSSVSGKSRTLKSLHGVPRKGRSGNRDRRK